jgi:hypothetical protein
MGEVTAEYMDVFCNPELLPVTRMFLYTAEMLIIFNVYEFTAYAAVADE